MDSTQNIILRGNFGIYNEKTDYSLITDSASFIQIGETDSMYMHADTIMSLYKNEETKKTDEKTEKYRIIQAFHRVKIYKTEFQVKCDSLVYTFKDSVMELHSEPVIWSENNQLTADFITIMTRNNEVDQVNMEKNSFIISQSDSVRFNQIKGNRMIGLVSDRELFRVDVFENGESLYFLKDDNGLQIGSNHITCKNMNIYLKDKAIDRIWFYENPKAIMKPPNSLGKSEKSLTGFRWEAKQRPMNKNDVFLWHEQKIETANEEKDDSKHENKETGNSDRE